MSVVTNRLIPTLNNMGYSPLLPDPVQKLFIEYAVAAKGYCLDVGAAFGVATVPAVLRGAKMIANDLDQRHLDYIADHIPAEFKSNMQMSCGSLPSELSFAANSLDGILVARVLNFLSPPEIMQALKDIYTWLIPGGKLFLVVGTPFLKITQSFIPVYLQRKANGDAWPGVLRQSGDHLTESVNMPQSVHLIDEDVLRRALLEVNYAIETLHYFPAECPVEWLHDGREFLGCVAIKS